MMTHQADWPLLRASQSRLQSPVPPCPSGSLVAGYSPKTGTKRLPTKQTITISIISINYIITCFTWTRSVCTDTRSGSQHIPLARSEHRMYPWTP